MSTGEGTESMKSDDAFQGDIEYFSPFEAAPVAIIMSDTEGQITLVNQQAESLFGWAREELLGRPIETLIPEHSRGRHPRYREGFMAKPESRLMGQGRELYALHKSGAVFPAEVALRPVHTPDGMYVLSTVSDVTERRRHELATARLAAVVESAQVAMITYSTDGIVTAWNRAADRLYEYSAEEMIGESVLRITPPELQDEVLEVIEKIKSGELVDHFETDRLRKSGGRVRVSLTVSPIQGRDGRIVGVSSIGHDITRRVALEAQLLQANEALADRTVRLASQARELQEANRALEQSNKELQQFAYVASHDLQAPLRSINGFVQLLREEYGEQLDAQGRDWIQRVLDSVEKLQALIKDLLSYARVDSGGSEFESVSLSGLFDDTVRLLASQIEESAASVTRDELPTVRGDPTQLARVLENLIENALKYRGTGPSIIHMAAEDQEDCWLLSIRDNGIGIDPQFHEQIFEIFRRLHTDRAHPGTGIGLAVCRRVIQRHGGTIWVESAEGRGSTFSFTLPKI